MTKVELVFSFPAIFVGGPGLVKRPLDTPLVRNHLGSDFAARPLLVHKLLDSAGFHLGEVSRGKINRTSLRLAFAQVQEFGVDLTFMRFWKSFLCSLRLLLAGALYWVAVAWFLSLVSVTVTWSWLPRKSQDGMVV